VDENSTYATDYSDGTLLNVWIQPRASRSAIVGVHGDSIKIAVQAPPAEGRANEECIALLSNILSLPKRELTIKSGQQSRHKTVFIKGVAPEMVIAAIENALKKA
jgi:hypothetical protein